MEYSGGGQQVWLSVGHFGFKVNYIAITIPPPMEKCGRYPFSC